MSRTEQQYVCLSISFSAYDGCLVLSTEEEAFTYLGKGDMASAKQRRQSFNFLLFLNSIQFLPRFFFSSYIKIAESKTDESRFMPHSFDCIMCCMSDRCDGGGGLQSDVAAYVAEIPLLQHAGPRSVAPSGRSHGQRREEELRGLCLRERQIIWFRKGMS